MGIWTIGLDTDHENDWRHEADGVLYNAGDILDSDGDNLSDGDEYMAGLNPLNPDMDNDGLLDGFEMDEGLDPTDSDSDDNGTLDGDEIDPETQQPYSEKQRVNGLTVATTGPSGWAPGGDLGLGGVVTYTLTDIDGFAVLGRVWEGGATNEDYLVDVQNAAFWQCWEKQPTHRHKMVIVFAVPNGTNEIRIVVTDNSANAGVQDPNEQGADIRAAFQTLCLDVELDGMDESEEENPGLFLGNALVHDVPRAPCRLKTRPKIVGPLPGDLNLTWDPDVLHVYSAGGASTGDPLDNVVVPLANFPDMDLWVEGIDAAETDLVLRWNASEAGKDIAHVICHEVCIAFSDNTPCDGIPVTVDLDIRPASVASRFQQAEWTVTTDIGTTVFENPAGRGIELTPVAGTPTRWLIDNARWYESPAFPCARTSTYVLQAECSFGEFSRTARSYLTVSVETNYLNGSFKQTNYWSGIVDISTAETSNGMWVATVSQGSFRRNIQGTVTVIGPTTSQFYAMILAEENAHAQQYGNPGSAIIADLWDPLRVMATIAVFQAQAPFVSTNAAVARDLAWDAYELARQAENKRSAAEDHDRTCALEAEAKQSAGSSHCMIMECTYPGCF